jgi:hypothetical protein
VVGVVGLHLLWVLAMNVRFEEVAAQASADLAKRVAALKERRAGGVAVRPGKAVRSWFPLASTGRPAVAIVWKNTVALMRTGMVRTAVVVIVVTLGMSYAMTAAGESVTGPGAAIPFVALAAMAMLLGPRAVRNDLRQDLLNLATIKTYPLSGAAVVFAEMVSPTLVLTLFQLIMLALAYLNLPTAYRGAWDPLDHRDPGSARPHGAAHRQCRRRRGPERFRAALSGMGASGSRFGRHRSDRADHDGDIGSFLVVLVGLLLPALSGAIVYVLLRGWLGGAALAVAGLLGVVVLGVEVALMVAGLGAMFERTDPTALG